MLLIETKMDEQLLGYFIAFCTSMFVPPLIFVLSETIVKLVILPFYYVRSKECGLAIEGVLMPDMLIWTNRRFNEQLLVLLLILGQLALTYITTVTELKANFYVNLKNNWSFPIS